MLQTRYGKRTGPAAVKIAVDMAGEDLITREEAIQRVDPAQIVQLLLPRFDEAAKAKVGDRLLGKGLNASPGPPSGRRSSTRIGRSRRKRQATRSSWCASRPAPTTCTACLPQRAC